MPNKDTPFRKALTRAFEACESLHDKQYTVDLLCKQYPAEDHARELLEALEELVEDAEEYVWTSKLAKARKAISSAKGKQNG